MSACAMDDLGDEWRDLVVLYQRALALGADEQEVNEALRSVLTRVITSKLSEKPVSHTSISAGGQHKGDDDPDVPDRKVQKLLERPVAEVSRRSLSTVSQCMHDIAQARLRGAPSSYIEDAQEQLRNLMHEHEARALRRQAARGCATEPGALDQVVGKKLATLAALTPEESRKCLVSCIRFGRAQARRAEGKEILVVIGNTGAGKSALINLLH